MPYKGGGPAAQALAANEVQVDALRRRQFPRADRSRQGEGAGGVGRQALAAAAERADLRRGRPGGYPGQGWWGLAAPKGTPPAIVDKVNAAFVKLFSEPKFIDFLDQQAVVPAPTTPAGFAAFLKEDRKAAEALIKIANSKREEYKPQ